MPVCLSVCVFAYNSGTGRMISSKFYRVAPRGPEDGFRVLGMGQKIGIFVFRRTSRQGVRRGRYGQP